MLRPAIIICNEFCRGAWRFYTRGPLPSAIEHGAQFVALGSEVLNRVLRMAQEALGVVEMPGDGGPPFANGLPLIEETHGHGAPCHRQRRFLLSAEHEKGAGQKRAARRDSYPITPVLFRFHDF